MHKLNKYAASLLKDKALIVKSEKSSYYNYDGHILRISDHVGRNSSGSVSIIIIDDTHYILHRHSNGKVFILNYEQAKEFVKSFSSMASIFDNETSDLREHFIQFNVDMNKLVEENKKLKNDLLKSTDKTTKGYVLGVPLEAFTKGQIAQIKSFLKQNK